MKNKKVMFWDDERDLGNSLIVTLNWGWEFGTDPFQPEHVRGFDTIKDAKSGVKYAIKCVCEECVRHQ